LELQAQGDCQWCL